MSDADEVSTGGSVDETTATPQATQATTTDSVGDILNKDDTQEYVKGIAAVMAVTGVALGILVILLGAFGDAELTANGASISTQQYKFSLVSNTIGNAPFLAFPLAAFFGLRLAGKFEDSREELITAATGVFVGTVLLLLLTEIIASTQTPSAQGMSYSIDYGTAIVNSIVVGVATAITAAGTVYSVDRFDF